MSQPSSPPARDHLFISYATENEDFALWLARKLTAAGYRVWCDRFCLLGGESYPRDIDLAIKLRTFRFLALLSRHSVHKDNPRKERTIALNVGRERKEDFVIPLNIDGLKPTELDWMHSDITFIAFHHGWAEGLRQLLKKLDSVSAPRTLPDGERMLAEWANAQEVVRPVPERLWSNVLSFTHIPELVLRVTSTTPITPWLVDWPHYRENDNAVWVFELPETFPTADVHIERISWRTHRSATVRPWNVVTNLLRRYLHVLCTRRGLRFGGTGGRDPYFPTEITDNGYIPYTMPSGRKSRIRVTSVRNVRHLTGEAEQMRYHLRLFLRPTVYLFDTPCVLIRVGLLLTDAKGQPLPPAVAFRRERKMRTGWRNNAWLSRILASVEWLRAGEDAIWLGLTEGCRIELAPAVATYTVPVGYDEQRLGAAEDEDEEADEAELLDDGVTPGEGDDDV